MRAMLVSAACAALLLGAGCSGTPPQGGTRTGSGLVTTSGADGGAVVDIGAGCRLFLECRGTGAPTVVLISGFRGAHVDWPSVLYPSGKPGPSGAAVFPQVAGFTRVCAYDRPGTTMLDGTPTVLIAQSFATTYPGGVAGLVLVDAGSAFLQSSLTPAQWSWFATAAVQRGDPPSLDAAEYERGVAAIRAAKAVRPVPAVVLTSDHPFDLAPGTAPGRRGCSLRLGSRPPSTRRTSPRRAVGHFIHGERPDLVVDAVRGVFSRRRQG